MNFEGNLFQVALALVVSFSIAALTTPLIRKLALTFGITDRPNESHKTHAAPIPYLGGISIVLAVSLTILIPILVNQLSPSQARIVLSVLIPGLLISVVGLIDDIKKLSPWPRLVMQTVAGVFTAILLVVSNTMGNPTNIDWIDISVTVIWIVGITNSLNFLDNLDGGAIGTSAIISIALVMLAASSNQPAISSLAAVLAGASLGFLLWNRSPARIYMGDSGALFVGFLLAVLAVRLEPPASSLFVSFLVPIMLLGLPLLDTSVAVVSRIAKSISPLQGGQDHLSHRLMGKGFSKRTTAITIWLLAGWFSFHAVATIFRPDLVDRAVSVSFTVSWIFLFIYFLRIEKARKS
jgi:UDP-GlcNAc:undecaprenyl-phosphate GlcNAc-1-phosphate transferase